MASVYGIQLQPWEENQSPSPVEEETNPYERSLSRSTSGGRSASKPLSSANTINSLHHQLSGASPGSPVAWTRRSSVSTRTPASRSPGIASSRSPRSPSEPSPTLSRRLPNLAMTTTRPQAAVQTTPHESPSGPSTSPADDPSAFARPQPSFVGRPGSHSNRSSIHSQDLSSLTSEELWNIEHDAEAHDDNNPSRPARERPLDTVRHMSMRYDRSQPYQSSIPDVIWPSAPSPEERFVQPIKSRSASNVVSLGVKPNKRMSMSRRWGSRQRSLDITQEPVHTMPGKDVDPMLYHRAKSTPGSPDVGPHPQDVFGSAHSSSVSLASSNFTPSKSQGGMPARPPSTYYSRDILSALAPREGGYAIAAQMGGGLGAVGTMAVDDRRRSALYDEPKRAMSRAPMSKSTGMGRWSLDGGEHYSNRPNAASSAKTASPYATVPGHTTSSSSNLSAPPITSAEPSPTADDTSEISEAALAADDTAYDRSAPAQVNSFNTSVPISSNVDAISPGRSTEVETLTNVGTSAFAATPSKKERKAAEKMEAEKVAKQRALHARDAALQKKQQREAEARAKQEVKTKVKEDKERAKAEKKAQKLKSPSTLALPFRKAPAPAGPAPSDAPATFSTAESTPISLAPDPVPSSTPSLAEVTDQPFSQASSGSQAPPADFGPASRPTRMSMSLGGKTPSKVLSDQPAGASGGKAGMLGTIRKRWSFFGNDTRASVSASTIPTFVRGPFDGLQPGPPAVPVEARDTMTDMGGEVAGLPVSSGRDASGLSMDNEPVMPETPAPVLRVRNESFPIPISEGVESPGQATAEPIERPAQASELLFTPPARSSSRDSPASMSYSTVQTPLQVPAYPPQPPPPAAVSMEASYPFATPQFTPNRSAPQLGIPLRESASRDSSDPDPNRPSPVSVRGPRSMPSRASPDMRSRPASIVTPGSAADALPSSPMQSNTPSQAQVEIFTPSTSGESSNSLGAEIVSAFASEESRKSSMTSEGYEAKRNLMGEATSVQPPERVDSKSSTDTISARPAVF